jgi:hypothetical protein
MINYELKLNTIRWMLLAVTIIIALFSISDLSILPVATHEEYIISRFYIQIPSM